MADVLRMLLTGLIAAFCPSFWNLASVWVFRADLREASNFAPVGVIQFSLPEDRSTGTAFVMGDCSVIQRLDETCAHAAASHSTPPVQFGVFFQTSEV